MPLSTHCQWLLWALALKSRIFLAEQIARWFGISTAHAEALAGGPIEGLYEAEQPGHALNNRLLRAVFADETAFAWQAG